MRLLALDVQAFMRLRPFRLELAQPGLIQVIGENLDRGGTEDRSNASGKSLALVEALPWALYGKMVRHGERNCKAEAQHAAHGAHVIVYAAEGGVSYAVERRAPLRGTSKFQVLRYDGPRDGVESPAWVPVPLSRDLTRRVDEASELLGVDYATFRHAFVVRSADSFPAATYPEQMAVLEALLRLSDLSAAADLARRLANETQRRVQVREADIRGYERQVETLQSTLLEVTQPHVVADRTEALAALQREIKDLDQVAGLAPSLREVVEGTRAEVAAAGRDRYEAQARQQMLQRERQEHAAAIQADVCAACARPFADAKQRRAHNAKHRTQLDVVDQHLRECAKIVEKAAARERTATARLEAQQAELQRVQAAATTLSSKRAEVAEIERWLRDREQQGTVITQQIAETDIALGQARALRAAEALTEARQTFWGTAFGRDGLQADLYAAAMPVLNRAAAHAAQVLTEGQIEVTFPSHRTSVREDLVRIRGASAPTFEGCSGGEQDRLTLICAWALRALARWRLAEPFNVAVYDECFDRLDPAGLQAVAGFLIEEAQTARVFVVTHNDRLKALLPWTGTVRVTRSGGEATVEVQDG